MCIRDSPAPGAGDGGRLHRRADPGRGRRHRAAGRLLPAGAVSYTHLRAHETVLDLVCRLLLEKKKRLHEHHDRPKRHSSPRTVARRLQPRHRVAHSATSTAVSPT